MKILICAATALELSPLEEQLEAMPSGLFNNKYTYRGIEIHTLVTGVGCINVSYAICRFPKIEQYDLAISIGICGAYNRQINIGAVVHIASDILGDLGMEQADGSFQHISQSHLSSENLNSKQGYINTDELNITNLPRPVRSVTFNTVTGTESTAIQRNLRYHADIESMESFAFISCLKKLMIPHLAIRSVSNYVEERNVEDWDIPLASSNLAKQILKILDGINQNA